jgi:hypothetical protein
MKIPVCRMLIVGMLVGWLGVTLSACAQHDSEPIVQGKTLSVWLQQYNSTAVSGGEPKEQAEKAVRLIGTNAIPALLKMITQSSFWPSGRVTVNIRLYGLLCFGLFWGKKAA